MNNMKTTEEEGMTVPKNLRKINCQTIKSHALKLCFRLKNVIEIKEEQKVCILF